MWWFCYLAFPVYILQLCNENDGVLKVQQVLFYHHNPYMILSAPKGSTNSYSILVTYG